MSQNSQIFKSPSDNPLSRAARWLPAHGYAVFPVHNAIFDAAGNCTGCTCEHYHRQRDPHYKCKQPGKCPRVKWSEQSTTDLATINKWWGKAWRNVDANTGCVVWNVPNIGIDVGKSGLIALDFDTYKAKYAGDALELEHDTVEVVTGGGGTHLWFRMPDGKAYSNATGTLPDGIDVRGAGGYVIAPPSVHHSGRAYAFAPGKSPAHVAPAPLPASLAAILEAAQTPQAAPVTFGVGIPPMPDLAHLGLKADVLELIHAGAPKGDRSEADYRVIRELLKVGASDDAIRGVFTHFAIGAKYGEDGDKYLARTIGKARAWLEDHPPAPPATPEELAAARAWARGPECVARLRAAGNRRVAELIPLLDANLEIAQAKHTRRIQVTIRDLADRSGMSKSSAQRRLARLADVGLIALQAGEFGTLVDLSPLLDNLVPTGTLSPTVNSVPVGTRSEGDFFTEHRTDDAFTVYPYRLAIKRRMAPTVLLQSLGASGLLLWTALDAGGGTVRELAEATGLTISAVRSTLKRFVSHDLVVVWQEGQTKQYWLYSNAASVLEERREHMATFGIGQLRAARNAGERADFAHRQLTGRNHLDDRQRARLELRRERCDRQAVAYRDALAGMGIDPAAKVMPPRPARPRIKFDARSEWGNWAKDLWETLRLMGEDVPLTERVRLFTIATVGEDADAATFGAARRQLQERAEMAMSLAPRRAQLECWQREEDDAYPAAASTMPTAQPGLFAEAA